MEVTESEEEFEETDEPFVLTNEQIGIAEDETPISDIGLPEELVEKLHTVDIWSIEEFFDYTEEELIDMGLATEEIEVVRNSVVISEEEEVEEFECPICHSILSAGTSVCPSCGAEFEFE